MMSARLRSLTFLLLRQNDLLRQILRIPAHRQCRIPTSCRGEQPCTRDIHILAPVWPVGRVHGSMWVCIRAHIQRRRLMNDTWNTNLACGGSRFLPYTISRTCAVVVPKFKLISFGISHDFDAVISGEGSKLERYIGVGYGGRAPTSLYP